MIPVLRSFIGINMHLKLNIVGIQMNESNSWKYVAQHEHVLLWLESVLIEMLGKSCVGCGVFLY